MAIVVEILKDINKLCRTCMNIIEDDDDNNVIVEGGDLCKMLKYVTSLNLNLPDGLPHLMCKSCVEKLQISYVFKEQCFTTYSNFREFIDSSSTNFQQLNEGVKAARNKLICENCSIEFETLPSLYRHELKHDTGKNLLERYLENNSGDKLALKKSAAIPSDVKLLIQNRKLEIDDLLLPNEPSSSLCLPSDNAEHYEEVKEFETIYVNGQENLMICDLCDRIFENQIYLSLHFMNHAIVAESSTSSSVLEQHFFCHNCGEIFTIASELESHISECTKDSMVILRSYDCGQCSLRFNNDFDLLMHEKYSKHTDKYSWADLPARTFMCPLCGESFSERDLLNVHAVKHVVKRITCRICKKMYCTEAAYNNHLQVHPSYKHMCSQCGKFLGSRYALKTHVLGVHSDKNNYTCQVCLKGFKTPGRLYTHKLTHKEDKKFVCAYCAYRTNNVGDFKVHTRTHTEERPYKCTFTNCTRQFKTSSHLNEHFQRHLQIKKFKCDTCQMVFGHSHSLKMHHLLHTGEKPFSCDVCNLKFRRKHHLKSHMKQHAVQ